MYTLLYKRLKPGEISEVTQRKVGKYDKYQALQLIVN